MMADKLTIVQRVLSLLLLAIALMVVLGWIIKAPVLVQPIPTTSLMQVNTALCFGLIALTSLFSDARWHRLQLGALSVVLVICLMLLYQHSTGRNIGIDTLLIQPFIVEHGSVPGRTSLETTLTMLVVVVHGLWSRWYLHAEPASGVTLGVIALVGGAALLNLVLSLTDLSSLLRDSADQSTMAVHTSFGFFLVTVIEIIRQRISFPDSLSRVDLFEATAGAVVFGVMIFYAVASLQDIRFERRSPGDRSLDFLASRSSQLIQAYPKPHEIAFNSDVRAPDAQTIRLCRIEPDAVVIALDLSQPTATFHSCGYEGRWPTPGGSVFSYISEDSLPDHKVDWTYTSEIVRVCTPKCRAYMALSTLQDDESPTSFTLMQDIELSLTQFLRAEGVPEDKIQTLSTIDWMKNLDANATLSETLDHFTAAVVSSGIGMHDFNQWRSSWIAFAFSLVVVLATFVLIVINQRNRTNRWRLAESNRLLQVQSTQSRKFVYAAAHDLRAPMRGIQQLAKWSRDDLANEQTDDLPRYMELIENRTTRLSQLMEGLLEFAKVGSRTPTLRTEFLRDAVQEAIDFYAANVPGVTVTVQGLTQICTYDHDGFVRLLGNLISNSINHHDRDEKNIEISGGIVGKTVIVDITDDGPGISEERQSKVFEMFKSFTRDDQASSSGMGLAICARMIDEWGGTIEIQSPVRNHRGTTFQCRIPLTKVWRLSSGQDS